MLKKLIAEKTIIVYFILVFILSWTIWIFAYFFTPVSFIAATLAGAWIPSLVALYLIYVNHGKVALITFLKKLWVPVKWYWYGIVLFSIPLIYGMSVWLHQMMGGQIPPIKYPAGIPGETPVWLVVVISYLVGIFFGGPLAEDIGWRGYIVPKLHEKYSALSSAIIVGLLWMIWHVPFFFMEKGAQVVGYIPFYWFAPLTISWGVLFAWVYFNTNSILMPVLYHASINTTLGIFGATTLPDGTVNHQLMLIITLTTLMFVLLVVNVFGYAKLTRSKSVPR